MCSMMVLMASGRVRGILQIFLMICLEGIRIDCQLNLYNTDRTMNDGTLHYDCLYYRVRTEKLAYQELSNTIEDAIPYCFRPVDETEMFDSTLISAVDRNLTFEELRFDNITPAELLGWSAPIDLVEEYRFYLNERNSSLSSLSDEVFYNCTKPWFGLRCEYSFDFSEEMSINHIVQNEFFRKMSYSESSDMLVKIACYVHLPCDRGGSSLCLDWREVCDGRVDCLDGGLDEAFCFDMEMSECKENEYRCHNGLCIPEEFWEDGIGEVDCLDRSDEIADIAYLRSCYRDPTFRCEEHSCRANWHEFSCGDGQCVQKFDQCHNGRHSLLVQSMIIQGNLSDKCWIAMTCLTKLVDKVNGMACQSWLTKDSTLEFVQTCKDSIIEYPHIPIHLGHIRLLYEKSHLKLNESSFVSPDYVCYDAELCDCIVPTFFYRNLSCIHHYEFQFQTSISTHPWIDLILEINSHFSSCMISHSSMGKQRTYSNSPLLYSCQNSSKLISKGRIADENKDCCMGDDEDSPLSCSLNDTYRVRCPNGSVCLSSLHSIHDCPDFENQYTKKIPFHIFCDGVEEHIFEEFNGERYTDESECDYWPCDNVYSRCDGYWTCHDGKDEEDCHSTKLCPSGRHPCISPSNYSFSCLSAKRVGDEINDCLGASDELQFCRELYPSKKDYERFRCSESDLCLPISDLCDNVRSCPQGDDEKFCSNHRLQCQDPAKNRTLIEDVLCQLSEYEKRRIISFSLRSPMRYPPSISPTIDETNSQREEQSQSRPIQTLESLIGRHPSAWNCYRGLPIRIRSGEGVYEFRCLCPPSYYGHLCQYQNERISLTLGFIRADKHDVYTIVTMLIDSGSGEMDSYDQFDYAPSRSCGMKFNRYLLYSTRPKNISKSYYLRLDAFEKRTMRYRASWHLSIPFLFLPVNRLVALLVIPSPTSPNSSPCSMKCNNGECLKYENKEETFCRCFPGWSGVQCDVAINCQSCSPDSICVGRVVNRSICVCPVTKFGPRCLLASSCPLNACENNGQCIPADLSVPESDYDCICPDGFFGSKCQYVKGKLDVSIEKMDIPSYVIAFFFTVSEEAEPRSTIMLQKLTLFQHVVTFRISIAYHIAVIKSNERFYLAVIEPSPKIDLSTSINPFKECFPIENIFNSTLMKMPQYQRIKFAHLPCQTDFTLNCFLEEDYLCFCTADHQANCMGFDRSEKLQCSSTHVCANAGRCLQDHPSCPSTIICVCQECFFGDRCQFYAKGFGLTLDEILGYEIQRNVFLSQQVFSVKFSAAVTMIMFAIGFTNGICSILTFSNKTSQEVGCGMYLLASSITSLIIVVLFALKFWFLFLSYSDSFAQRFLLYANCMFIEPLLKILLYTDNWFNGCIATERAFAVFKGISFNKSQSKCFAKWIILLIIIVNIILLIPQLSYLHLFDDRKEERTWCVILYSPTLDIYNSFLMIFHFFTPFLINFSSAIFIIIETARQRAAARSKRFYVKELRNKLKQHKHILLSPMILILLSLPRLIITFKLNCNKSSKHFWLYLLAYFVSFMPAVFVFVIFVLPSAVFGKAFEQAILRVRRRLSLFKMKFYFGKRL